MYYYDEPYLAHYGVKGMRWGVRKARQYARYGVQKGRAAVKGAVGRMRAKRTVRRAQRAANARQFNRMSDAQRLNNLHLLDDPNRARRVEAARKAAIAGIVAAPVAAGGAALYKATESSRNYRKKTKERLKRQQQRG